jgi:multidrug efflux pump subunit AcrA (membrane-fusion protein)
MNLLDKLLGRKKRNSETISNELAAQSAQRADALNRVEAAKKAREAALDQLDKAGMKAADEARVDAENDVALAERAIATLQTALSEQTALEEREAFRREVEETEAAAAELRSRILREYPDAAGVLGAIAKDLRAYYRRRDELQDRGRKLGEAVTLSSPEDFRAPPVLWSVRYPNPEGHGVIQTDAGSAPRGTIRWEGGVPVPARDGVKVEQRTLPHKDSLATAIGTLPGLRYDDPAFCVKAEPEQPVFNPPEWGLRK